MIIRKEVGPGRREIEDKISKMGDYVKMDFLSKSLSSNLDFETRKFVMKELSSIYESKGMMNDAAKIISSSAEINSTFTGKVNDYMRAFALYVKGNSFNNAENAFGKAMASAEGIQKDRMKQMRKEVYKKHAEFLVDKDKRKQAMEAYEQLLSLDLNETEKRDVKLKLMSLYEKLGKIREYYNIKKSLV